MSGESAGAVPKLPRFDCPISWCSGEAYDHGLDGEPPERWLHMAESIDLHGLGITARSQQGTGPARHYVALTLEAEYDTAEARDLAARLRLAADLIERAAAPAPADSSA